MFERYTDSARRAVFYARYEVAELGGAAIDAEHLLLGLLRTPTPIVERLFGEAHVSPASLETATRKALAGAARIPTSVEIPFSPAAKLVLQCTAEEADGLRHRHIGTEHLLLALIREGKTPAGSVLAEPAEPPARDVVLSHIDRIQQLVEQFARDAIDRGASPDSAMVVLEEIASLKRRFESEP